MPKKYLKKALSILLSLTFVSLAACAPAPPNPAAASLPAASQNAHIRRLQTPGYVADRGAVIFSVQLTGDPRLKNVTNSIIRIFAENKAPLDIAVSPQGSGDYSSFTFLQPYIDAGILDLSINGLQVKWPDTGTDNLPQVLAALQTNLQQSRDRLNFLYGDKPVACIVPAASLYEGSYSLIQNAGFKAICSQYDSEFTASSQPVNWSGKVQPEGLYRIPMLDIADYSLAGGKPAQQSVDPTLLADVANTLDKIGAVAIEIEPQNFLSRDNIADTERLAKLSDLVKASQKIANITTFEDWCAYTSRWATPSPAEIQRVLPPYNGEPAIIFRMDDVSVGWHEDADQAIIETFKSNGVPLDVGIVSNVEGTNSYQIPWLKKYFEQGNVGISVHGYDWTYYQLDTTWDASVHQAQPGDICYVPGVELPPPPKDFLTYDYIKMKLMQARDAYLQYFGVKPVALTVPTDYFDETGYRAINDAGFKVFSTHISQDQHPSNVLCDFNGRRNEKGMYRIPTASDVCVWENCTWGDVYDISDIRAINDYCKYHSAWDEVVSNDFGATLCSGLGDLGVAAISIHPDAFVGIDGKPNQAKLQKLDAIIKWCKTVATITTFEQWYNYQRQHQ